MKDLTLSGTVERDPKPRKCTRQARGDFCLQKLGGVSGNESLDAWTTGLYSFGGHFKHMAWQDREADHSSQDVGDMAEAGFLAGAAVDKLSLTSEYSRVSFMLPWLA